MVYIGLRYTNSKNGVPSKEAMEHIINWISSRGMIKYVMGVEKYDKCGELTNEHIHCHAEIDDDMKGNISQDTLQRSFKKYMLAREITVKGNDNYSLKTIEDCDDEQRFFRYPLKEKDNQIEYHGFESQEIHELRLVAVDERKQQVKKNKIHRENYLDKSSFKGKMYDEFDQKDINTYKEFFMAYYSYCLQKYKTPTNNKVDDYYTEYRLVTGRITVAELWEIKHGN